MVVPMQTVLKSDSGKFFYPSIYFLGCDFQKTKQIATKFLHGLFLNRFLAGLLRVLKIVVVSFMYFLQNHVKSLSSLSFVASEKHQKQAF